jgi:acylphosphatase
MKIRITITGKVHDVGYRPFLLDLADSLLIERFDARNVVVEGKQAVIVLVEGDEDQINQFIELVKKEKPENAVVEEIKIEEYKGFVRSIDSYRQSLMVSQLNKIVQVGLQMLHKQDLMLHKQDLMLQKQDLMLQKQDETIREIRETRKHLSEKIDRTGENIVQEIRELRMDLKTYLDERLRKIEEEINAIKSKLGMI